MTNVPQQIRDLLANDQTEAALDALMRWAKDGYRGLYDQCILLRSRWEKIEEESNLGLISREEAMRQTMQVNAGVLALVSGIEQGKGPAANRPPAPAAWRYWPIVSLIAGALALGGVAFGWFDTPAKADEKKEAAAGATVIFPGQKSLTLTENGEEVTYELLDGRLEKLNGTQNRLTLRILCSPMLSPRRPMNFWAASFRFAPAGGAAEAAPSNDLNLLAESHASTEGELQFLLPTTVPGGRLSIKFGQQEGSLEVSWH